MRHRRRRIGLRRRRAAAAILARQRHVGRGVLPVLGGPDAGAERPLQGRDRSDAGSHQARSRTRPTCGVSSPSGWSAPISPPRRSPPPAGRCSSRPSEVQAHLTLAELYRTQKNWPEAEAELEKVITLNPDAEEAYLTLARYLVEQKAYDRARAVLLRLVERQPKNVQAQFLLGRLAIETENWDEAISRLTRAVELDPDHDGAWTALGLRVRVAASHRRGHRGLRRRP